MAIAMAALLQACLLWARVGEVDLQLSPGVLIPATELRWRFSRSSGPGGQNVNTTDSRVELVFDLAGSQALPPLLKARALQRLEAKLVDGTVVIAASEHRSQWQNRVAAQRRLVELLQEALKPPPPPRRPTKPTRGSKERRLAAKKQRSAIKGQRRGPVQLPED
jgi:ribosome-associated protein